MPDTDPDQLLADVLAPADPEARLSSVLNASPAAPVAQALGGKLTPLTGDEHLAGYAARAAAAYDGPDRDRFHADLTKQLRTDLLQKHLADERQWVKANHGPAETADYWRVRLPIVGSIEQTTNAANLHEASQAVQNGNARGDQYQAVARHLAEAEYAQSQGWSDYAVDLASQLPKEIIEWMALTPFVKAPGKVAGELVGGGVKGFAATQATRAALRTGLRADKLVSQTAAETAPRVGIAGGEIRAEPGEEPVTALRHAVISEFLTNLAFEASGAFEPKGGGAVKVVGSTAKALGAVEAGKESAYWLGGGGEGSVVNQLARARDSDERKRVLSRFAVEAGVFGALETGMHTMGREPVRPAEVGPAIDALRQQLRDAGVQPNAWDAVIGRVLEQEAARRKAGKPSDKPQAGEVQPGPAPEQAAPASPAAPAPTSDLDVTTRSLGLGPALKEVPTAETVPPETVGRWRAIMEGTGMKGAAKWSDDRVVQEARKLRLHEFTTTETTSKPEQPQKAATYAPTAPPASAEPQTVPEPSPKPGESPASQGAARMMDIFPEGRPAEKPEFPGQLVAEIAGRKVYAGYDEAAKAVRIDFDPVRGQKSRGEVGEAMQPGAMETGRALRELAGRVRDAGLDLTYTTDARRAKVYERALKALGWELDRTGPDPAGNPNKQNYVWKAAAEKAVVPAGTAEQLKARMRAKQGFVRAKPQLTAPEQIPAAEPDHVARAFDEAKLTEQERAVLWGRARLGETLEESAESAGLNSRQRADQIFKAALDKLGLTREQWNTAAQESTAEGFRRAREGRKASVEYGELHGAGQVPLIEGRLDEINKEVVGILKRRPLTPEEEAKYVAEVTRLNRIDQAGGALPRAGKAAERHGPAPVRPERAGGLPEGDAAPEPAAAPEGTPVGPPGAGPAGDAPAAAERGPAGGGLVGHGTAVAVPGGEPVPARYEVREMASVRASHQVLEGGAFRDRVKAGEYPEALQPRDYRVAEEQAKVLRMASEMKTGYWISTHPDATSGPPVVTPDGAVLNGNGRHMGLERSVHAKTYGKYKAELVRNAEQFGIDPEAVRGMENPVLVRVVDMHGGSPEARRFAREGNVSTTMSQSPARTAAALSGMVDDGLLGALRLRGDTTFSEAVTDPSAGRAFRDRLRSALPLSEVPKYFHPDGRLTDAGVELARNMLLAKVLPVALIEKMGESMKAVKRTVEGALPQLLQARRDFPAADVTGPLVEALGVMGRNPDMRSAGDAANVLAQGSLFGGRAEPLSPAGRMVLDFLLRDGQKPLVFRQKLAALVEELGGAGGLFSGQYPDVASMVADVLHVERREGAVFGRKEMTADETAEAHQVLKADGLNKPARAAALDAVEEQARAEVQGEGAGQAEPDRAGGAGPAGGPAGGAGESVAPGEARPADAPGAGGGLGGGDLKTFADFLTEEHGFVDLDRLRQKLGEVLAPIAAVGHALKVAFNPAAVSASSRATAGNLRENLAKLARRDDVAMKALYDGKAAFDRLTVAEKDPALRRQKFLAFTDPYEAGQPQTLPPEQQALAAATKQLKDDVTAELSRRGLLQSFIDNHLGHLWKDPRNPNATPEELAARVAAKRPLTGGEGFRKQRQMPTWRDGIDAGLEPATWNPVEAELARLHEMYKSVFGHDVFGEEKATGRAQFVRLGAHAPAGWVPLGDKLGTVFARLTGTDLPTMTGHYYMPEESARLLDRYLQPGLRGNALFDAALGLGNEMNKMNLGWSAYHALGTAINAQVTAMELGIRQVLVGHFGQSVPNLLKGTVPFTAVVSDVLRGTKLGKEWFSPGSQGAQTAALAESFERAGGRAHMAGEYQFDAVEKFRTAVRQKAGAYTVLKEGLRAVNEAVSYPIMGLLVPRAKMGAWANMARFALEELGPNATPDQQRAALQRQWQSVENRMGQMTYDNLFWDRTMRDLLHLTVRSVGWNAGDIGEFGGAAADVPSSVRALASGRSVSPRLAYMVALPIVAGINGAILQYLLTGKGPDETKDLFFPKTGKLRPDGSPDRLALPTYMKDFYALGNRAERGPFQWAENAYHTGMGKRAPLVTSMTEMLSNRDFYDKPIRNPEDPLVKQAQDEALHLLGGTAPFSATSAYRQHKSGAGVREIGLGLAGLGPAPAYVTRGKGGEDVEDFYDQLKRSQGEHTQFLKSRRLGAATDYGPERFGNYRLLAHVEQRMTRLNRAMQLARTDEQKAEIRQMQVRLARLALRRD